MAQPRRLLALERLVIGASDVDAPLAEGTAAEPELSIVIPAVNATQFLRRTLQAVLRQPRPERTEVLVVDRLPSGEAASIQREFPRVRIVPGHGLTIPQMRGEGIRCALAPIVAILEDHMEVTSSWQDAILAGHSTGADAVGGPITNGCLSPVDWAAFFTEYSEYMPPLRTGPASSLAGSNVAYKRAAIEACGELFFSGVWETFVHEALARRGFTFRCESGAEVVHAKPFSALDFASQRWHLARSYAGMRTKNLSGARRLFAAIATPLRLPWRMARIVNRILARDERTYRRALSRSFPWLLFFLCVWAMGDVAGYFFGEGNSTARVM